ncbi:unnamed protein product [Rotaria sordida]|uniref:Fucosyltransferase n=1 Tax=Rotaria sordida TaxID=392033 RepID=A0A814UTY8_9BILA|nr:unnamed protein product [Rotaria sordida]CAF3830071.1 unnamed protein product [Rotaria sordida]
MWLIIRYLSLFFRSRRHFSFLFVISLFFLTVNILFTINDNRQSVHLLLNPNDKLISKKPESILLNGLITKTNTIIQKKGLWPVDEKGRSLKTDFLVLTIQGHYGSYVTEGTHGQCSSSNTTFTWTTQKDRINEVDFVVCHGVPFDSYSHLLRLQLNNEQQQYSMGFILESEANSPTEGDWTRYNFKMSYNLDDSYPEPATYFDVNLYIIDLLKPPSITFEQKEKQADIVWIISNCQAYNGRHKFVQKLMQEINIDSYGLCLNNRQGLTARLVNNTDTYKKYKFVIAIENSNCIDYITEKLIKVVASGSIPIVAGLNGRPDYRRFMPEHSYINIYDYTSVKTLANDLKRIADNKTLYESYLWYKKHNKNITQLSTLTLDEKIKQFADVIGSNAILIKNGIIRKEKSDDKICKLIRFIRQTPWQHIATHHGKQRRGPGFACLARDHLSTYFDSLSSNSSQTTKHLVAR